MKFLLVLAAVMAAVSAGYVPTSVSTFHGNYGHGLAYGAGYGGYGYGGYAAPIVKAYAPLATSYANVHSVHNNVVARPYGYYGAPVASYGLGYGHGLGYARTYGHGLGYGYGAYHH